MSAAPRLVPPLPVCDDAEFAADGRERVWLSRKVADEGPVGLIIALNPSTAGADVSTNDQTITKLTTFTRQWGWSGFWMTNLFTCIETYSSNLKNLSFESAVGLYGSAVLDNVIPLVRDIVVCWGAVVPKDKRHRIGAVHTRLRHLKQPQAKISCLGLSKEGCPAHPSRLAYSTPLVPYVLPPPPASRYDD